MLIQEKVPTESVVYDSSIDALHDLLSSCQITEISTSLSHLINGIEYSFVEITCSDGIQYGLQAYGQEALELNRVALENLPKKQMPPMVVFS
jgi:hypothetical protein